MDGVTSVYISQKMLNMMHGAKIKDVNVGALLNKITGILLLDGNDKTSCTQMRNAAKTLRSNNYYEEMMQIRQNGNNINVLVNSKKKIIHEILLLIDKGSGYTIIQIQGKFDQKDIQTLMKIK